MDPFGIVHGLLVTFDDVKWQLLAKLPDGPFQEAGLTGARRADQVQCQHIPGFKISPVALCQQIVPGQNIQLDVHLPLSGMIMVMGMIVPVCMGMLHPVVGMCMDMFSRLRNDGLFPGLSASATVAHLLLG
jgi:hypothetical protein